MSAPTTKGLHHVKLPVSDLGASLAWYQRVLGAQHLEQFDHYGDRGERYAVILAVPGCDVPVELRWAPNAAQAMNGYDPVDFAAGSAEDVAAWAAHLDAEGIEHSPVSPGAAGALLVFPDPDGTFLRMLELPAGGVADIKMAEGNPEPDGPWLAPPSMRHPGQPSYQGTSR
ncbi:MAG: VOC family protein [Actinobacteria bacterium]|nr:VOC family protein [Actinomycetota bacterium]